MSNKNFDGQKSKDSLFNKIVQSKIFKKNFFLWIVGFIVMIIGAMIKNNSRMLVCMLGFVICMISTSQIVGFINKLQFSEKSEMQESYLKSGLIKNDSDNEAK